MLGMVLLLAFPAPSTAQFGKLEANTGTPVHLTALELSPDQIFAEPSEQAEPETAPDAWLNLDETTAPNGQSRRDPEETRVASISRQRWREPQEDSHLSASRSSEWHAMPAGLMYRSYLAGEKEPRMSSIWMKDDTGRTVWENTLGGRIGLVRYGTDGAFRPQGWQLDVEGAALARVLPGTVSTMLEATDYRAGLLVTWAEGPWHAKAGYYHLSSHLGDEFVIANPGHPRFNYVRDSAIVGVTYDIDNDWQTYGEVAYAFSAEDGAEPLELQYGIQYSPLVFGQRGAPFVAVNGHSREDFDFMTSITAQAGWQWRGTLSQRLWRVGVQYYNGPALQYSFPGKHDHLFGAGAWLDF